MSRYTLSPEAGDDLDEIIAYLRQIPDDPANRVGGAIRQVLESIGRNPMQGIGQSELTRLAGFEVRSRLISPYRIFYRMGIRAPEVIGVLHTARDVRSIMAQRLQ